MYKVVEYSSVSSYIIDFSSFDAQTSPIRR